jgi:hypothetical protein
VCGVAASKHRSQKAATTGIGSRISSSISTNVEQVCMHLRAAQTYTPISGRSSHEITYTQRLHQSIAGFVMSRAAFSKHVVSCCYCLHYASCFALDDYVAKIQRVTATTAKLLVQAQGFKPEFDKYPRYHVDSSSASAGATGCCCLK